MGHAARCLGFRDPQVTRRPLIAENSRYHRLSMDDAREVAGTQPPLLYPAYQSTVLRAPSKPLIQLPRNFTDLAAPLFGHLAIGEADNDLTRQHSGEPLGERIVVAGRVVDEDGRPVPDTLGELCEC